MALLVVPGSQPPSSPHVGQPARPPPEAYARPPSSPPPPLPPRNSFPFSSPPRWAATISRARERGRGEAGGGARPRSPRRPARPAHTDLAGPAALPPAAGRGYVSCLPVQGDRRRVPNQATSSRVPCACSVRQPQQQCIIWSRTTPSGFPPIRYVQLQVLRRRESLLPKPTSATATLRAVICDVKHRLLV